MIGAVAPTWLVDRTRQVIRFEAAADEGADVVACLIPGTHRRRGHGGADGQADGDEPGLHRRQGDADAPGRASRSGAALPLRPATVAVRLVAETSKKRFNTFSRTLR